jgi:hypothetical protein
MSKIKKTIAILLVVLFVVTVTAGAASAEKKCAQEPTTTSSAVSANLLANYGKLPNGEIAHMHIMFEKKQEVF